MLIFVYQQCCFINYEIEFFFLVLRMYMCTHISVRMILICGTNVHTNIVYIHVLQSE